MDYLKAALRSEAGDDDRPSPCANWFERGEGIPYGDITNLRPESIETVEVFKSWH